MKLNKIKKLQSYKTLILVGGTLALFILAIILLILSFRKHIIDEKKIMIKELVESANAILTEYNRQVEQGTLTLDEAQELGKKVISTMRYGPEMKDYFWINDMDLRSLVHPYYEFPYGYDLSEYKDPYGDKIFVEFKKITEQSGSGYHTYYWQWKDNPDKIARKISYVKGFKPWGWMIGTGIYVEEVNEDIYEFGLKILIVCFFIFILIILLSITIIKQEKLVDRKRSEAVHSLKKNQEMLENITDSVRDAIIDMEPNGRVSFWNPAAEHLTGYSASEAIGKNLHDLLMPREYEDLHQDGFRRFQKTGRGEAIGKTTQWKINTKSGNQVPVELSLSQPIKADDGWRAVGILRNISERIEAENALRESEEMFKALAEKSHDIIARYNRSCEYTYANPIYLELMGVGLDDILHKTPSHLIDAATDISVTPELVRHIEESIQKTLETGEPTRVELNHNDRIYDTIFVPEKSQTGEVLSVMRTSRDITESIKLQNQLMQTQKVESIGTLAGGIAHDFNNILFPIIGYTELSMEDVPKDSRTYENLSAILKAATRAGDLVKQILTFTRQSGEEYKPLLVQLVVKEALKLLRSSIPKTIDIHQKIDDTCRPVMGDPTQIHQVVMNLCTNAYHAMEGSGGRMDVTLSEKEIGADTTRYEMELKPGHYLKLSVKDNGHGMTPDMISRIFDPYYTTKKSGKGTGLGLSVTHGIITKHGGNISVHSKPDAGTTFHAYIPIIEKEMELPGTERHQLMPKGSEHILVVDDEEPIVDMLKETLVRLGYQVTTRTSSVEALEAFKVRFDNFDLVITDMNMPKMTGIELAEQMIKIRRDIPIILCTGFSDKIDEEKAKLFGIQAFAMKPIVMTDLAERVRGALDNVRKEST